MLAHELSHVAHRDVLVMTVAASAGIVAGMVTRGAQFGGLGLGRSRNNDSSGVGYFIGAALMIAGGLVEAVFGVKAEGESLENIARPLTAEPEAETGGGRPSPQRV